MAFITYILLSGLSLGSQGRFDPEKLGEITSMATGWIVLEVLLTLFDLALDVDLLPGARQVFITVDDIAVSMVRMGSVTTADIHKS